jgi:hypothetical protein
MKVYCTDCGSWLNWVMRQSNDYIARCCGTLFKGDNHMNTVETEILNAAQTVAPDAPAVQVAAAAVATATDPSPSNILADVELLLSLGKQIKALAATHPTLSKILAAMF